MSKSKKPSTELNSIDIVRKLKPFVDKETRKICITNDVMDKKNDLVTTQHVLINSKEAEEIFMAVVWELLERIPSPKDIEYAILAAKGWARQREPREASNLLPMSTPTADSSKAGSPDLPALPADTIRFFLDAQDKLVAEFLDPDDGRVLPFSHPSVKGELISILTHNLGRQPNAQEVSHYFNRCAAEALKDFRSQGELRDELLASRVLIRAAIGMMIVRYELHEGKFAGNLTDLRNHLEKVCEDNDLDCSNWPKKHHLAILLRNLTKKGEFGAANLELGYTRKGLIRECTLDWIDKDKIPEWEVNVTQGDAKKKKVASPGNDKDDPNLFEEVAKAPLVQPASEQQPEEEQQKPAEPPPDNKEVEMPELPASGDKVIEKPFPKSQEVEKERESQRTSTTAPKPAKPVKTSK